jgi:hypothetical protein
VQTTRVKTLFPKAIQPIAATAAAATTIGADRLGHAHTSSSPCQTTHVPAPGGAQNIAGQTTNRPGGKLGPSRS